jgi:hypothetical protein
VAEKVQMKLGDDNVYFKSVGMRNIVLLGMKVDTYMRCDQIISELTTR